VHTALCSQPFRACLVTIGDAACICSTHVCIELIGFAGVRVSENLSDADTRKAVAAAARSVESKVLKGGPHICASMAKRHLWKSNSLLTIDWQHQALEEEGLQGVFQRLRRNGHQLDK
jgi:hypothetical protein